MKKLLLFGYILLAAGQMKAQVVCPIPCSLEQFPYIFCQPSGNEIIVCSSDPNTEGGILVKAFLPNCIHVDQTSMSGELTGMPPVGKTQALGTAPGPMPMDTCGTEPTNTCGDMPVNTCGDEPVDVCGDEPIDECGSEPVWDGDSSDYDDWLSLDGAWHTCESDFTTAHDDWVGCKSTFNTDSSNWVSCTSEFITDSINWVTCESNFITDSSNWAACDSMANAALSNWDTVNSQLEYVTVWNDADAQADANSALSQWYAACPGLATNNCCVRVNFDQQKNHFSSVDYSLGIGDPIEFALTPPPPCSDSTCPDSNSVFININVSEDFLFASNATDPVPDSNYPASVASRTFFTGPTVPNVNPGFETISFREVIEHELGHWLGFSHTNVGGCPNNTDSCMGFPSVMNPEEAPNTAPMNVTCEDLNMFRKLYCPSTPCQNCLASVSETVSASTFKAIIFPNPTSGACLLQYQVTDPASVQISIYDMLGKQVRLVFDGYDGSGPQSISLGTESLPSGNYVCSVRVGDQVSYISLSVTK